MEMKYLVEQDTDNIALPVVHVKGITGLNVNPSVDVSTQNVPLISEYFVTGSKASIVYFDNIVWVSVNINLNESGIAYLKNGNTIKITSTGFNNTEDCVLDCIITKSNAISKGCLGYVYINSGAIYISAKCKQMSFIKDPDNPGGILEEEITNDFNGICGNALTTTKSFAPIKPITPKGYIIFTIAQRCTEFTIGPIKCIGDLDITGEGVELSYKYEGSNFYNITVTGAKEDYTVTFKGSITSVVYPNTIPVFGVEIRDCGGLTWFSVRSNGNGNKMVQNSSIREFSLYGKHRITNMTYFLSELTNLTTVKNLSTEGVTMLDCCFKGSNKLTQLPVLDLKLAYSANEMCSGCTALSYIPDTIDWSHLVEASMLFYKCSNLIVLPFLNTTSLMYADYLLFGCSNLTTLNMTGSKLEELDNIFIDCVKLSKIIMTGITKSIHIEDTNLKTKSSIKNLVDSIGNGVASNPSIIYLPQAIELYDFDNDFIKTVIDKNWKFG